MLDGHPPRAAIHTWRNFFRHIAATCVGLLIPSGLQQPAQTHP